MAMKPKLSKNVFQMKFMKRSREKYEKEELEEEQKALFDHDITDEMRRAAKVCTESSYIICENLRFGRMSFHGFNADVEKLQKKTKPVTGHTTKANKNEGMPDEEFAESFSNVVGTMKKKFVKKRQRTETKEEQTDSKKQDNEEREVKKAKVTLKITDEGQDAFKTLYPRRKRAAEFWKPETN